MTLEETVAATRRDAALFDLADGPGARGLLEVRGDDRVRWLDGMISGDVQALEAAGSGSGCYATMLTNRGAIVADVHVVRWDDAFWLETLRSGLPHLKETLERYVIADDVELVDRSADHAVLGLEGPAAMAVFGRAAGRGETALPASHWARTRIDGREVVAAAFGGSGEPALQLRMAPGDRAKVEASLDAAAPGGRLVRGDLEALEVLRVEAGIPALGRELDEEVLPPEARLDHAVSTTKGCYVGQEIVARLRSRGRVNHLLVGLRLDLPAAGGAAPDVGADVVAGGRTTGEITSVVCSPSQGWVALGYVRREHAEPETAVDVGGVPARVAALPFVAPIGSAPPPSGASPASSGEAAPPASETGVG